MRRARAVNAQRAYTGPAGVGSKVNMMTLKAATKFSSTL